MNTIVRSDWQVDVPEGKSGEWEVRKFSVDAAAASWQSIRAIATGSGRGVPEGEYTQLVRGKTVVMSDTPDEIRDHVEPYIQAKKRGGRVLLHGLGLGMVLGKILTLDNVTGVDVVERSEDVIRLVAPSYTDPRVTIHHGDAFTYRFPMDARWSVAWHDIWDFICADNLPEMAKLHRRYGRRVDWQGSWAKYQCQRPRWR